MDIFQFQLPYILHLQKCILRQKIFDGLDLCEEQRLMILKQELSSKQGWSQHQQKDLIQVEYIRTLLPLAEILLPK
jgi:hypothetical protein